MILIDFFSQYNNNKVRDTFLEIMNLLDLNDVWRMFNLDSRQYSCCRPSTQQEEYRNSFSRLDMFFISNSLLNSAENCVMQARYRSDHSFVILDLKIEENKRGPTYWKFNNSLLKEQKFVQAANTIIEEAIVEKGLAPGLYWEMINGRFIEFSKKYSIDKAKNNNKVFKELQEKIEMLRNQIEVTSPDLEVVQEFQEVQNNLKMHMERKANGAFIRSRTQFYQEGERSSKYYFSLEKSNANRKTMRQIKNTDGITITDQKLILQEQVKYFKKLYKTNKDVAFNLINTSGNYISNQVRDSLEGDITVDELTNALFQMQNNKAPGIDGLTAEAYKMFWKYFKIPYHKAILEAKEKGKLHLIARREVITLIPKKEKDFRIIENWRPITMLTCDYKILAKSIALRMQPILPQIISEDQTGFIKNCNIATNLRKTVEVVQYAKNSETPVLIMTIDYRKCFDLLEHKAIWGSLRYFNFGEKFISWVQL